MQPEELKKLNECLDNRVDIYAPIKPEKKSIKNIISDGIKIVFAKKQDRQRGKNKNEKSGH